MYNLKQLIFIGMIFLFAVTAHGEEIHKIKVAGNTKVARKILKSYTDNFGGSGIPEFYEEYATIAYRATTEIKVIGKVIMLKTDIYPDREGKERFGKDACSQVLSIIYDPDPDFDTIETVEVWGQGNSPLARCEKLKRR